MLEHPAHTYRTDSDLQATSQARHNFYKDGVLNQSMGGVLAHPIGGYCGVLANLKPSVMEPSTGEVCAHFKVTPERTLEFFNYVGEAVGVFDFSGPELKFTGRADESAEIFIKAIQNCKLLEMVQQEQHV